MNSNHAINYSPESGRDYGKSYAMMVYEAIHNDAAIKQLWQQRMIILDNRTTTQLNRTGLSSWSVSMFTNEQAEQLEKINKELQERYEALAQEIRQKLLA